MATRPARDEATVRERIRAALLDAPATARDLSRSVGVPEHDLPEHLRHLQRSLRHRGEKLMIEPAACLDCGFAFTRRERYTRPGGCPRCRGRRIGLPRFHIERH